MDKTTQSQIDAATLASVEADNERAAERHVAHAAESYTPATEAHSKRCCEATARTLRGVPIELADAICGSAMHCAAEHRRQGWTGDGDAYDIGVYTGDLDDLAKLLGRRPSRDEELLLNACIRCELDASE